MEYSDFISSGIGAVLGFVLAEFVNLTKLAWNWWNRAKLVIQSVGENCVLLSHSTEAGNGELYKEDVYGFYVRNTGRGIATGVRIQLIQIEIRGHDRPNFSSISEHAYDLPLYKGPGRKSEDIETVLVPGATVVVQLAERREDHDAIFPAVSGLPHYYEEGCAGSTAYRFTVVAFDDHAQFVRKVLTIS